MKFMTLVKASESSGFPPPELMDAIGKLGEEATQAGTMIEMGGLLPTAMGTRIRLAGGQLSVIDGPFTEAKEVVGGYAVYDVPSKEEAVKWATRFMQLHQDLWPSFEGEVEVRQLFDASDFDPGAMQA
jgi:hypothetical protein